MDAPSSYPNFLNLATELGGTASPTEEHELIDRYLGRLVEKGITVHERVKTRLSDPTSRPNHLHETVIRLFGSADNIRIVTTNFDDHFRGAAQTVYGAAPEIYRAPALPSVMILRASCIFMALFWMMRRGLFSPRRVLAALI